MARHGSRHCCLYQQVLDVFKDEGRLSEPIWVTGTTRNTPLEMGKYSHGFYNKPVNRDGNKIRTRWGPDIRTRFDRGIPELTRDGDGDGESPILKTGMGARMGSPSSMGTGMGLKFLSPSGIGPGMEMDIEIGDGDGDGKHDPRNSPTHCHPYLLKTTSCYYMIWVTVIIKGIMST
ncbi:hypothetical protein Tco_0756463 [Tanacetum coccineum]